MYILKMKAKDGTITTFQFLTEKDINLASCYFRKTDANWFSAICKDGEYHRGKIVEKHESRFGGIAYYDVQWGAYRDEKYAILGTEEQCSKECDDINNKCECWADDHAKIEHLVGPLWQVVVTRPFTD